MEGKSVEALGRHVIRIVAKAPLPFLETYGFLSLPATNYLLSFVTGGDGKMSPGGYSVPRFGMGDIILYYSLFTYS